MCDMSYDMVRQIMAAAFPAIYAVPAIKVRRYRLPAGKSLVVRQDGECLYVVPGHDVERLSRDTAAWGLRLAREVKAVHRES